MATGNVVPRSLPDKVRPPSPRSEHEKGADNRPTWGNFIRTVERCRRILDDEPPLQLVPDDGEPAT